MQKKIETEEILNSIHAATIYTVSQKNVTTFSTITLTISVRLQ